MAFTPNQWAIVALVLVAGWLLGLASHSGGRKWKQRYATERDAHAAARRDYEARLKSADDRALAAEREHARLAKAAPVTASTIATRPLAQARPARLAGDRRGWFDWNRRTPTHG